VTTSEKFYPANAGSVCIEPQEPVEVWQDAPAGVCVENYYFEYVPLELITGFITDAGILKPDDITERLKDMPLSPFMQPSASE
ncbi:MAG: hypothetical protein KAT70_02915, partial [Thermoplasmata archaeon]|nr:hypothetical protein [Thermoplasmata archaeon]